MSEQTSKGKGKEQMMSDDTTTTTTPPIPNNQATKINPQPDSILFRLPLEIRLDIYAIYIDSELQSQSFMTYSTTYLTDLASSRIYRASPPPSLARTCKLIYRELEPLFKNIFAIHVMPATGGPRIGMGGYSPPSRSESDGTPWDPANPNDGGGLILADMRKCIIRMNASEMESMDCLSDFFAQVVSNDERERTKPALWEDVSGLSEQDHTMNRGIVPLYMGNVLPPTPPAAAPTLVYDVRTRRMRGMGQVLFESGPSKYNGLGKAAVHLRELIFEYAPIKTPGWRKVVPEGLKETQARERMKIEARFWSLVREVEGLEVIRLRGDCPGWWRGYLERRMRERIEAGTLRIVGGR